MSQDNDTEAADEQQETNDDSSVIKTLRKELREALKELKAAPDRDTIVAEVKDGLTRDLAIESQLIGFGHPAGILETVKGKLGDADVSPETVAKALESVGYKVDVEGATSDDDSVDSGSETNVDLVKVTQLSAEVQSASKGKTTTDVTTRIAQAETNEEVNKIMAEEGLLTSGY